MKRLKTIIIVLLAFIAVCFVAMLADKQKNNIDALILFFSNDTESLEQKITENEKKYDEAISTVIDELDSETELSISKETHEKLSQYASSMTPEQIAEVILTNGKAFENIDLEENPEENSEENSEENPEENSEEKTDAEKPEEEKADITDEAKETEGKPETEKKPAEEQNDKTDEKPSQSENEKAQTGDQNTGENEKKPEPDENVGEETEYVQPDDEATREIAATVARLYVIKGNFTSKLSAMEQQIISQYVSLDKENQVPESRKSIARQYVSYVSQLESECDAEVEEALSALRDQLAKRNMDTSVTDTLREAYNEEKSVKKAYYLDVYSNGI